MIDVLRAVLVYTLSTLIGDQGILQIIFWSLDSYSDRNCITEKPLILAQMYMFHLSFSDKHYNYLNCQIITNYSSRNETENRHFLNMYNVL